MKRKGRLESSVQSAIIAYLAFRPDFFWFRVNTGATKFGKDFVRFGTRGAADLLGLLAPAGRLVGIECKREIGGELSAHQEAWGANVVAHGGIYIVARDVQDVIDGLGPPQVKVQKHNAVQRTYPRGQGK